VRERSEREREREIKFLLLIVILSYLPLVEKKDPSVRVRVR
jgi:hypothetical protein